jgi:polysaccharide biosynthesis protein PelC
MERHLTPSLALALALAAAGCGATPRYVNKSADLGAITSVAVLPFENVTTDKLCAERVHKIFVTELLARDAFKVVEPGQVARVMRRDQLEPGTLAPEDIKRVGQALGAQALFMGAILEYDEGRSGGYAPSPRVKLLLRLVDVETGTTLWSVSRERGGTTVSARLFGIGGNPASSLAEQLIREELAQFAR